MIKPQAVFSVLGKMLLKPHLTTEEKRPSGTETNSLPATCPLPAGAVSQLERSWEVACVCSGVKCLPGCRMKEANKGLGCRTGSQSFSLWLVLQTLKILHAEQKQEAPGTGLIIRHHV